MRSTPCCASLSITALSLVFSALPLFSQIREIYFKGTQDVAETRLSLAELGSRLPADWTEYEALVIEFRASSPQRIQLKVFSGAEGKYSRVLLHPYPGAWVRAAIPLANLSAAPATGFDMASVGNRSHCGYYLGLWGPFVPLKAVSGISFTMEKPIGSPRLELRSVQVVKVSPGDAVLGPLPLVDEFGQWALGDWPGKVHSLKELKNDWGEEERALSPEPGYSRFGGFKERPKGKASGFFRVEKVDERWWFIDPEGYPFLSVGSDVMRPEMRTRREGRTGLFAQVPPENLLSSGRPVDDGGLSFFTWNLARRFGREWRAQWIDFTFARMESWALNTVANWSDPELWGAKRKPYVVPLGRWETKANYLGLPDVYAEEFKANADAAAARQCEPLKDDPFLLGYFLANEPPFPQKELQTVELILAGPDTATKQALQTWLKAGDTPARRKEFIADAFERYIRLTSEAVRKNDPNHLNLGMRSGGRPTEAEIRVSRHFDVYSVNVYDYQLSPERMKQITELTGKPVLIGEFHFGVPGRGLAASLVQVKDQHERGVAYRYYVEQAFSMPGVIGTHWFQWADQPVTGRFDGENYNLGLVDVTDRPYYELVNAMKTSHTRLWDIHSGRMPPVTKKALVH